LDLGFLVGEPVGRAVDAKEGQQGICDLRDRIVQAQHFGARCIEQAIASVTLGGIR